MGKRISALCKERGPYERDKLPHQDAQDKKLVLSKLHPLIETRRTSKHAKILRCPPGVLLGGVKC